MKKITILAVIAALMLAVVGGIAIAESGSGKSGSGGSNSGSGSSDSGSGGGNSGSNSSNSGKKMVTYNFFGTVTAVTPGGTVTDPNTGETPTTSPSVMVDVKKGNRAGRDFAANGSSQMFNVASSTKIEINGNEDSALADVQVGDEVKVQVKAAPTATTPLTARQLEVKNDEDSSSDDS